MAFTTEHAKRSASRPENSHLTPTGPVNPPDPRRYEPFPNNQKTQPQHHVPLPPELWADIMSHALRASPEMPDVWRSGRQVSRLLRDATDQAFFLIFMQPLELEVLRDLSKFPPGGQGYRHHHYHDHHWGRATYSILKFSHLSPCGGRAHYTEDRKRTERGIFGRERRVGLWLRWQLVERRRGSWPSASAACLPASRLHMGVYATEPSIVSPILVLSRSVWVEEQDLDLVGLDVDRVRRPCEVAFDWRRIMHLSMGEFRVARHFYAVR
jgi:hypothetical protein